MPQLGELRMQTRLRRFQWQDATARGQMLEECLSGEHCLTHSGRLGCVLRRLCLLLVSYAASCVTSRTVTIPTRTRRQRALARHPWERHPSAKFAAAWANSQRCAR